MDSKIMQVAVVVLAVMTSTQACTSCNRWCPTGTACRLLEVCFSGCELFPICPPLSQFPSSSVCPGNDPIVSLRGNIVRCRLTEPEGSRCPGDSVCIPSTPGTPFGVCCPCGSVPTPAPLARLNLALQASNTLQADSPAASAAATRPAPTEPTTARVRCPFFGSACGRKK